MGELTSSLDSSIGFDEREGLVDRLREGDEQAFAEAFHLYKGLVYTLCCKMLADRAEASDVTQEVFLTLFRKIHQFRGECSLKTWLYRVTLNQASNRNRWWKRRSGSKTRTITLGLHQPDEKPCEVATDRPSPERAVHAAELRHALNLELSHLPFKQRTAVILRDVQGLSYEEISEITGVEVGTVKSRIARGREKLRVALREFHSGRPL